MSIKVAQHRLCPNVMSGCDHPCVMNAEGVQVGCGGYRGPALLTWAPNPCGTGGMWRLVENLNECITCDWCDEYTVAAFTVRYDGWMDRACVSHALRYFPELFPAGNKRPAQYASRFMLRMVVTRGAHARWADWETYDRSDTLLAESRFLDRAEGWRQVTRSSNAHYHRSGAWRGVWENANGVRIALYAVVR